MITCPACRYFYVNDWEEKDDGIKQLGINNMEEHKEKFIVIDGTFLVDNDSYCGGGQHKVELKSCPKCGCVQMVDW
jgi:hypothetical protein